MIPLFLEPAELEYQGKEARPLAGKNDRVYKNLIFLFRFPFFSSAVLVDLFLRPVSVGFLIFHNNPPILNQAKYEAHHRSVQTS